MPEMKTTLDGIEKTERPPVRKRRDLNVDRCGFRRLTSPKRSNPPEGACPTPAFREYSRAPEPSLALPYPKSSCFGLPRCV
jgi:hypothetical protein